MVRCVMERSTLLLGLSLLACSGTRTGNPMSEPPQYTSGSRLAADPAGGTDGTDNGGDIPRRDVGNTIPNDTVVLHDGALYALVSGGLRIYDVSDPEAPVLRGELPIVGYPLQLEVDAEGVTAAVHESPRIVSDRIPEAPLGVRPRLLRIDVSNPARPERIAEVDLDEQFWRFERRGNSFFVLQEVREDAEASCGDFTDIARSAPPTRAMRVVRYELASDALVEREAIELPADESFAWVAGGAYFTVDDALGPPSGGTASLSLVDFDQGELVRGGPIELVGLVQSVDRRGELLVVLTHASPPATSRLQVFSLNAQGEASARGSVELPGRADRVSITSDGARALVSGDWAGVVSLADPDSPSAFAELPSDVSQLFELPDGVLGLGSTAGSTAPGEPQYDGSLVLSVWATPTPAAAAPERLQTDWSFGSGFGGEPYHVDLEHGVALFPFSNTTERLGAIGFSAAGFSFQSELAWRIPPLSPRTDGSFAINSGPIGLELLPLQAQASGGPQSVLLEYPDYEPPRIHARLQLDAISLRARDREEDGVFVLESRGTGEDGWEALELPQRADALVAIGDRVLVLGLEHYPECEEPGGFPEFEVGPPQQSPCLPHRRVGASVVAIEGEPRVIASVEFQPQRLPEPIEGVRVRERLSGYATLPDGRIALLARRFQLCDSQASCEALGVPAHEGFSSGGCNPDVQDCSMPQPVMRHVSGGKQSLVLYTLEGTSGDSLRLRHGVEVPGDFDVHSGLHLDQRDRLLENGSGFGLAREEPVYDEGGNSIVNDHDASLVRHYLEQLAIDEEGALSHTGSINTPGKPVAWIDDQLYSLEPSYEAGGVIRVHLHRSRLENGGAFIEESLELGEYFVAARAEGERLWVLVGPADRCAPDAQNALLSVSLEPSAMSVDGTLTLPGADWGFAIDEAPLQGDELVLRTWQSGTLGRLVVDVSDPTRPTVRELNSPY